MVAIAGLLLIRRWKRLQELVHSGNRACDTVPFAAEQVASLLTRQGLHGGIYNSGQDASANSNTGNYQKQEQKWVLVLVIDHEHRDLDDQIQAMKTCPKFQMVSS